MVALLAASGTFDAWTFDQFFPTCLMVIGLAIGRSDVIVERSNYERLRIMHANRSMSEEENSVSTETWLVRLEGP